MKRCTHFMLLNYDFVSFCACMLQEFSVSLINLNNFWTNLPPTICFSVRHCLSPALDSKVAAVTGEFPTTARVEATCIPNVNKNRALRAATTGSMGACGYVMNTIQNGVCATEHIVRIAFHILIKAYSTRSKELQMATSKLCSKPLAKSLIADTPRRRQGQRCCV